MLIATIRKAREEVVFFHGQRVQSVVYLLQNGRFKGSS